MNWIESITTQQTTRTTKPEQIWGQALEGSQNGPWALRALHYWTARVSKLKVAAAIWPPWALYDVIIGMMVTIAVIISCFIISHSQCEGLNFGPSLSRLFAGRGVDHPGMQVYFNMNGHLPNEHHAVIKKTSDFCIGFFFPKKSFFYFAVVAY